MFILVFNKDFLLEYQLEMLIMRICKTEIITVMAIDFNIHR